MFNREIIKKDLYQILKISPDATISEIKKAYRKLALHYHPDKINTSKLDPKMAEEEFKIINEAYEILSDPTTRNSYDAHYVRISEVVTEEKAYKTHVPKRESAYCVDQWYNYNKTNEPFVNIKKIIKDDNIAEFKKFLKEYASIDATVLKGCIVFAAKKGSLAIVKHLIEDCKLDPHFVLYSAALQFKGTILSLAAESGNLSLVIYLHQACHMELNSKINDTDHIIYTSPSSALCIAVKKGYENIVRYLITAGANTNPVEYKITILDYAIKSGNLSIIRMLIEADTIVRWENAITAIGYKDETISHYLLSVLSANANQYLTVALICGILRSGNAAYLKYIQSHDLFNQQENYFEYLIAAAYSGSPVLMSFLMNKPGLYEFCFNEETWEEHAICLLSMSIRVPIDQPSSPHLEENRLRLLKYLIKEMKLQLPESTMRMILRDRCGNTTLKINAYIQSRFPSFHVHKRLLHYVSKHAFTGLSLPALLWLYRVGLPYIKSESFYSYNTAIIKQVNSSPIADDEFYTLAKNNIQFRRDAMNYYCSRKTDHQLTRLRMLLELGVDLNANQHYGCNLLCEAISKKPKGDNPTVELLIAQGANIYQDAKGQSAYYYFDSYPLLRQKYITNPSVIRRKVVTARSPQLIAVADKPLRLGGEIKYITLNEAQKSFGHVIQESIDVTLAPLSLTNIPLNITGSLSNDQLCQQLSFLLDNPREDLVLCKINNEVGYGVFASTDIPENTLLCFYSGTLIPTDKIDDSHDYALNYFGLSVSISTKHHRGLSSFFQHLPSPMKFTDVKVLKELLAFTGQPVSETDIKLEDELYAVDFHHQETLNNLATENIRLEYINFNGSPLILMLTNVAVKAGDQLGFKYGERYFSSRQLIPDFFDKNGNVISPNDYRRTCGRITFDNRKYTYSGDMAPIINQLQEGRSSIAVKTDNNETRFVWYTNILDELLRVRAISNEEHCQLSQKIKKQLTGNLPTFFSHYQTYPNTPTPSAEIHKFSS